jgi:hypothetical protein
MKTMRTTIVGFLAAMLMAFALPASAAPEKIFSLNMSPTNVAAGVGVALTATLRNETPSGNSSINSTVISAPSGYTITAVGTPPSGTAVIAAGGGSVSVSNLSPVKPGKTFALALTVTISSGSANSCTQVTGTWGAQSWTGSSFSGDTFRLLDPPETTANRTTSVTPVCNYTIGMAGGPTYRGATSALTATFGNPSSSSSSFNSVTLNVPSGSGWTIAAAVPANWTATGQGTGSITLSSSTQSVAPNGSLAVPLQVSVPCGATSPGSWTSSVSGGFTRSGSDPSTTLTGACALQIVQQPQSAISGVPFAVQVRAVDGSGAPITTFSGPVTLSLNTILGSGSLATGLSSAIGGVVTSNATINGLGQFSVTATSSLGSASANITTSAFTVYQGTLNCGDNLNPLYTNPGGGTEGTPGYAIGMRWDNKDGSDCVLVDYTFTNGIVTSNTVQLSWNAGVQPNAVFDYTVFWRPEFVDPSTGLPKRRVKVAWELDGLGNPIYVWGNACLSKDPPAVYTTLVSPIVDTSTTSVTVNAYAGTLAVPFAVVIGTERMTVTSVGSGTNWTVVRGGSNGTLAATHAAGVKVMTTPLPIDPNATKPGGGANPYLGKQNRMCIWDESFQSSVPVGSNLYDCSPTSTGYSATSPVACVLRKTSVFDIGDGFMSLDN